MKYPDEISSDFYKLLLASGWFEERDIALDKLPKHIEEMPSQVKKFLREIWFISFSTFHYYQIDYKKYFNTTIFNFGETTDKLIDYSINDEDLQMYVNLANCKIRNIGYVHWRQILIDEHGRFYHIPDSGDLYLIEGKFYEGLYNLVYNKGKSYIVTENSRLLEEIGRKCVETDLTLHDFL